MKQLSILITLLIGLGFSSACWGEVHESLKVTNYKNIQLLVKPVEDNCLGISAKNIELLTKLKLLRNGIKTVSDSNPFIYIDVSVIDVNVGGKKFGAAYKIEINLQDSGFEKEGVYSNSLTLEGGLCIGNSYKTFERDFEEFLDKFILNYLESNME